MKKDEWIKEMIKAGTQFSYHLRGGSLNEIQSTLSAKNFSGKVSRLIDISRLPGKPLIDIADIADLECVFYPGSSDMYKWDCLRWKIEIEKRM